MNKRIMLYGGGAILSGLFFLFFTYAVGRDWTDGMDFDLTVRLQDEWLAQKVRIWIWIGRLGDWWWSLGLLVLGLVIRKRWTLLLSSIGAFAFCILIIVVLREIIPHPAPPFMFYKGAYSVEFSDYYIHEEATYPSGHAFRSMFVAGILASLGGAYVAFLCLPLMVGVAQILLGFHWTSDVMGGWLLGVFGNVLSIFITIGILGLKSVILSEIRKRSV